MRHAVADQQGADAQRAAELVGGDAQGGHAQAAKVDRQFPDHLDRIGVQGTRAALQRAANSATGCSTPVS